MHFYSTQKIVNHLCNTEHKKVNCQLPPMSNESHKITPQMSQITTTHSILWRIKLCRYIGLKSVPQLTSNRQIIWNRPILLLPQNQRISDFLKCLMQTWCIFNLHSSMTHATRSEGEGYDNEERSFKNGVILDSPV